MPLNGRGHATSCGCRIFATEPTVLVDQHAYLNLRPLRLAGLDPVYVNMDTLDEVVAHLNGALPHLLVFSPGDYHTDPSWWSPWVTKWPPGLQQRYNCYLAQLFVYTILADTGGPHEREEIERHLEEIDATFDFLDGQY